MTQEPTETAVTPHAEGLEPGGPQEGARTESVRDAFARLYADGRAYASAEADKQKLRLSIVGVGVRNAAVLGLVALMLAFASIVALLVGLVVALSRHLDPLWATLIVVGGGLLVTILLLLMAKGCITRMKKAITP